MTQRYDAERMLDRAAFGELGSAAFLHGQRPSVLELDRPLTLTADLGRIVGPPSLGEAAEPRRYGAFNPSIVAIDDWSLREDGDASQRWTGLCPRCAYVATLRVDALHQCDAPSDAFDGGNRSSCSNGTRYSSST